MVRGASTRGGEPLLEASCFFSCVFEIFFANVSPRPRREISIARFWGGFPNLLTMLEVGMQTAKYFSPRILDHGETRKCTMLANGV